MRLRVCLAGGAFLLGGEVAGVVDVDDCSVRLQAQVTEGEFDTGGVVQLDRERFGVVQRGGTTE